MKRKAFFWLLFIPVTLVIACCGKMHESQIVGEYGSDKFVLRDTSLKIDEYPLLVLNTDKTFELKTDQGGVGIAGSWKVTKSPKMDEAVVEFSFLKRKMTGRIRNTIFYFNYPNDFYDGKYESLLYVRLVR